MVAVAASTLIAAVSASGIPDSFAAPWPREMACLKLGFRPRSAGGARMEGSRAEPAKWISGFKDPIRSGKSSRKKVEGESFRGGEDLWASDSTAPRRFPEHLVIMVNGLVGR